MPTAPKLVAALLFALLGYGASLLAVPLMESSRVVSFTPEINALIGFLIGWSIAGPRSGGGPIEGMSNGLTATAIGLLAVLLTHGTIFSVRLSLQGRFREPIDALESIVDYMLQASVRVLTLQQILLLVTSGLLIGLVLELIQPRRV